MPKGVQVKIVNEAQVRGDITRYTKRKVEQIKMAVRDASRSVQEGAKKRVPVDLGNLKSSIDIQYLNGGLTGIIGPKEEYGLYVEFGTKPHFPPISAITGWANRRNIPPFLVAKKIAEKGTPPQPFLMPAFDKEISKFLSKVRRLLKIV